MNSEPDRKDFLQTDREFEQTDKDSVQTCRDIQQTDRDTRLTDVIIFIEMDTAAAAGAVGAVEN